MKTKQARLVYAGIILLSALVIFGSLYVAYKQMGGLETVEIYKLEPIKRTVVGKYFKTRYTDPELEKQFAKCKQLIASKQIDGDLMVVTYLSDSLEGKQLEQFIGIALKEDMAEIPGDFEVMEFESNERYAVFLSMHPMVRPTPEKLEAMIYVRAQEDGRELEDFFVEIHYQDNSMSLEGWIK